jgi:hypothetical protein
MPATVQVRKRRHRHQGCGIGQGLIAGLKKAGALKIFSRDSLGAEMCRSGSTAGRSRETAIAIHRTLVKASLSFSEIQPRRAHQSMAII